MIKGAAKRLASDAFLRIVKVAGTLATNIFRIVRLNLCGAIGD